MAGAARIPRIRDFIAALWHHQSASAIASPTHSTGKLARSACRFAETIVDAIRLAADRRDEHACFAVALGVEAGEWFADQGGLDGIRYADA